MKHFLINIVQGIAIGIANIIPGLSGATLALIMGIYEKIIDILTKFDYDLILLMKKFEIRKITQHISLNFLLAITLGIIISFIAFSRILDTLFTHFEIQTWAYFFGIIAASIFYIAKQVDKFGIKEVLFFMTGALISVSFTFMEPATENTNLIYVVICGIVGIVGMLIPGLSGSYLLVLLGNYKLILVDSIKHITDPSLIYIENYFYLKVFILNLVGHIIGILLFSRLIKWLIKSFKNITFSTLSGFIFGSLIYIWPWQNTDIEHATINACSFPALTSASDIYAIIIMLMGAGTIIVMEQIATRYKDV